jgi:choline-sulfatase
MNRRDFLKRLGLAAAAAAMGTHRLFAQENKHMPNFLFIFADDMTYESICALGYDEVQTPNLDRLVRAGTSFTHAYNQGGWSGALCICSRTMLNTGRFVWNAESVYKSSESERAAGRFWSEYLKRAGYETYMTGKWHNPADTQKAFDVVKDVRPGMPGATPQGYNRPIEGQKDPWSPYDTSLGGYWAGGEHWSKVVGDHGCEFLAQAARRDKPFFMYLAFNAPHDPRQSPKECIHKYPLEKVKVPSNFLAEYPYKDAIGCDKGLRDEKTAPFPRTKYAVQVNRQEYYAAITYMDEQVGRILDALEKSGKADNTYVFFTADQGLACGHHGLMGKQNLFDPSVRVPMMVVGPDVPKGKRLDTPVYLQDIMPTTLELAGVQIPDHVQFRSLMPIIRGRRERNYDAIYGGYLKLQRMVAQDGYKLLLYPKCKKALLFDLAKDPDEMNDLLAAEDPAAKAAADATAKKLFATLLELQKPTGDTLDIRSVYAELCP